MMSAHSAARRSPSAARCLFIALLLTGLSFTGAAQAQSADTLQRNLEITPPGAPVPRQLDLAGAMQFLHVPSIQVALIEKDKIAWLRTFGAAKNNTLYQAASLSKLVTAVAVLRLVEHGALGLDRNVNDDLVGWKLPDNDMTRGHPVTLRGLLSMTAGIGVPGYLGYEPGAALPSLIQILDGAPPANSQPVRVTAAPGSHYAYSGGGYEIVQALIEAKSRQNFRDAMKDLVLRPAAMTNSSFLQPPPREVAGRAATGHDATGKQLRGGWRIVPELAAGGLWSTAGDLAGLLVALVHSYRGDPHALLGAATVHAMMTRQNGGPYGLGAAIDGAGKSLVLMKRGQNVGYQGYMLVFPESGQGMVILSGSDNGTTLATALIRRAASVYHWPALGRLQD